MRRPLIAVLFSACLIGATAPAAPAQTALEQQQVDPCVQARADWPAIQRATQRSVVEAYRNALPAPCAAQRALAAQRLAQIDATPATPPPNPDAARRTRVLYECDNDERLRVLFDPAIRRASLSRHARPVLHMTQTNTAQGFLYVSSDGYAIEGDVNLTLSRNGGVITTCTPMRGG